MRTRLLLVPALSLALLGGVGTVGVLAPVASAADFPEPSLYPVSWQFDFEHSKPKRVVVGTDKGPTAFWYMTYRVTNNSDQEQLFLPVFEMVTKDGKVVRSDLDVPLRVFETIKGREGNQFLERRAKIIGPLLVGEDQAKDGVAVWREPDTEMGEFTVFITGLSGEYVNLDEAGKPVTPEQLADSIRKGQPVKLMTAPDPKTKEEEPVALRKTLQINYVIYGDEISPEQDEVVEKGEKWVMR